MNLTHTHFPSQIKRDINVNNNNGEKNVVADFRNHSRSYFSIMRPVRKVLETQSLRAKLLR